MSDPIDDLERLTMPGTTSPLPAAEVRRRGDRIRRRNHVLSAAGGLAVIAAIAAPIAAVALDHDARQVQPAPATAYVEHIPRTLDLAAVPADSPVTFTVRRDHSVVDDLRACGQVVFSTGAGAPAGRAVEAWGAGYEEPGTESAGGRTLALYPDADTATAAMQRLRDGYAECGVDERKGGPTFALSVASGTTVEGADQGFVLTQQVQDSDGYLSELTATEVARVGNAVLLSTSHTSAGGEQAIDGTVPNLLRLTAPVVDQMCVFSADPCES